MYNKVCDWLERGQDKYIFHLLVLTFCAPRDILADLYLVKYENFYPTISWRECSADFFMNCVRASNKRVSLLCLSSVEITSSSGNTIQFEYFLVTNYSYSSINP